MVFPIPGGPTTRADFSFLSLHVDSHSERMEMDFLCPITSFREEGLYVVVKDVADFGVAVNEHDIRECIDCAT